MFPAYTKQKSIDLFFFLGIVYWFKMGRPVHKKHCNLLKTLEVLEYFSDLN